MDIKQTLKSWTLLIAMIAGVLSYFIYINIPFLDSTHKFANIALPIIQPCLIFAMLFIAFCKINLREIKFKVWHLWLFLIQMLIYGSIILLLYLFPQIPEKLLWESVLLCFITPTATAAPVITHKLGGDVAGLTTYCILINLSVALCLPLGLPLIYPQEGITFFSASCRILAQVFPMLILPFFSAIITRKYLPKLHQRVTRTKDLAFYIWAVSLAISITLATKYIVHSNITLFDFFCIATISAFCCLIQFSLGHKIGRKYNCRIGAGQSLGQKNTAFEMWISFAFLNPVTSLAGATYAIWHNIYNSWQLYEKERGKMIH